MVFTYLVYPCAEGWRVQLHDQAPLPPFSDFAGAEHRARWLSARASVKGYDSEILLLDRDGAQVGRWHAERYETAGMAPGLGLAA